MSGAAVFDLRGRHALVTGAAGGIGRAIALGFAAAGATVTAIDVELADAAAGLTCRRADVTDPEAIGAAVDELGRLDAVVACAGIIRRGDEHDPDVFARVLEVNLTGTMRTFHATRTLLQASGGCAIATASMLSFIGGALVPGYAASKGGIVQLVKSLAIAWAPDVRVNAIAPGWIATPLTAALRDEGRDAAILARTPMGRWGAPEDVVGPALFLCSDAARFITGEVLRVDGGYLAA